MKYVLKSTKYFVKKYQKLTQADAKLKTKIGLLLEILRVDPKTPKLQSHKVSTSKFGEVWSIRVTGDIRILWNYDSENEIVLILLDIGGHGQVYI